MKGCFFPILPGSTSCSSIFYYLAGFYLGENVRKMKTMRIFIKQQYAHWKISWWKIRFLKKRPASELFLWVEKTDTWCHWTGLNCSRNYLLLSPKPIKIFLLLEKLSMLCSTFLKCLFVIICSRHSCELCHYRLLV